MSKSIKRFLSFILVLQLIIPYPTFAAATGKFTSVVGRVMQTRGKEVIKPVVKSPIQVKDIILTDKDSSAMMVFPDKSLIKLEQNSKLEINEFFFKEKSRTAIFSLAVGKMSATVNKFIGDDNVFEVNSPTAIVGVRGTGFEFVEALNAENKNMATVSCMKGSLNLSALSPAGTVVSTGVLEAGQVAVIVGGIITISAITAAIVGATGASATTSGAGTAAAATAGLSTTAIVGIAAGVAAVGLAGAAASGGGGGGGDSHSSTSAPTTVTGTWQISGRCNGASSDAYTITTTLNESSGGSFTGSGSGTDYDGTPLQVSLTGTYNSASKALSGEITTTSPDPCIRKDTFSTTLTSNDTGYIPLTQTAVCGCTGLVRMIKQ